MSASPDSATPRPVSRLLRDLRRDPSFRATFLAAVLLPSLCFLGVVGWIVLAFARS